MGIHVIDQRTPIKYCTGNNILAIKVLYIYICVCVCLCSLYIVMCAYNNIFDST